jgi:hypothetical protein
MSSETEPVNPLGRKEDLGRPKGSERGEKNWQEWVDEDSLQLIMQLVTTISFGVLIGLVGYNEFGVRSITELILTPETAFLVSVVTVCLAVVFTRE